MSDIYKKKIKIGDAVTIKFSVKHSDEDVPDIDDMTVEELEAYREELEEKIARLDAIEPADEESDEYHTFGKSVSCCSSGCQLQQVWFFHL